MTTVYSAWIDGKRPIYQGTSELRARHWANQFVGQGSPVHIYAGKQLVAYITEPDEEQPIEQEAATPACLQPTPPAMSRGSGQGQLTLAF